MLLLLSHIPSIGKDRRILFASLYITELFFIFYILLKECPFMHLNVIFKYYLIKSLVV